MSLETPTMVEVFYEDTVLEEIPVNGVDIMEVIHEGPQGPQGPSGVIVADLTVDPDSGLSVVGGDDAVIGSGTQISQQQADATHNGFLSMEDWIRFDEAAVESGVSSFNGRTGAVVPVDEDYTFEGLNFANSDLASLERRSYNDLQDLPSLLFGSHKITGGEVAWAGTGFDFIVSACDYVINGVQFHSAETPITLAPADPLLDRIDTFYVDVNGIAGVLTGTPGGPPVKPQVNPATQLELTSVIVEAGATQPAFTNVDIYLENTEWTMSTSAGSINTNATNRPYAGTKNIRGTNTPSGVFFTAVKPSGTLDPTDYSLVVFQIFCEASWPSPKSMSIFFMNGGLTVGTPITLKNGAWGFNANNTTTYQQIAVPVSQFNTGGNVIDRIRFAIAGGGGNINWDIDNIILQAGTIGGGNGGDFSTNTNVSVVGEVVLFADTSGKLGKRATGTGVPKLTSGVLGIATPGTDYIVPSDPRLTDARTANALLTDTVIPIDDSADPTDGQALVYDDGLGKWKPGTVAPPMAAIVSNFAFSLKRSAGLVPGKIVGYWTCPFAGNITAWNLTVDAGTMTVKIWKKATGTAHPTNADSITPSGLSISTGTHIHSTSLGGFNTTTVSVGDIFAVEIFAVSGVGDFGGSVEITRS